MGRFVFRASLCVSRVLDLSRTEVGCEVAGKRAEVVAEDKEVSP